MTKSALVLLLGFAACDPLPDWNFDGLDGLDDLFAAKQLTGTRAVASFAWVDGCPQDVGLFGCQITVANLATGAELRLLPDAILYEEDHDRVWNAHVRTPTPEIADVSLSEHVLHITGKTAGTARVELIDDEDNVVDTLDVRIQPIATLRLRDEGAYVLQGAAFGLRADAYAPNGTRLSARGALVLRTDALAGPTDDQGGFYQASAQFTAAAVVPGLTRLSVSTRDDRVTTTQDVRIVAREDITEIEIGPAGPSDEPPLAENVQLKAVATVDGDEVRGGPACDWSVTRSDNEIETALLGRADTVQPVLRPIYTGLQVFGTGAVDVECRANDRVSGTYSLVLGVAAPSHP